MSLAKKLVKENSPDERIKKLNEKLDRLKTSMPPESMHGQEVDAEVEKIQEEIDKIEKEKDARASNVKSGTGGVRG